MEYTKEDLLKKSQLIDALTGISQMTYHNCQASPNRAAKIRCVSLSDSKSWFCLIWQDESSLLVKYCPFCGQKAEP